MKPMRHIREIIILMLLFSCSQTAFSLCGFFDPTDDGKYSVFDLLHNLRESYKSSELVFIAKIIKEENEFDPLTNAYMGSGDRFIYKYKLIKSFKGNPEKYQILNNLQRTSLSYGLDDGEFHLLFASVYQGEILIATCEPNVKFFLKREINSENVNTYQELVQSIDSMSSLNINLLKSDYQQLEILFNEWK